MTLSLDQIDAALAENARIQRKLTEARLLVTMGLPSHSEGRLDSALRAFEGLAVALCIDLPETDAARSADMAEA